MRVVLLSGLSVNAVSDPGIRAAQLADQMRDYLAEWIARDFAGYLISVSQVTLRADLHVANVWLTFFGVEDEAALLASVRRRGRQYQRDLNGRVSRHKLPKLTFYLEKGSQAP